MRKHFPSWANESSQIQSPHSNQRPLEAYDFKGFFFDYSVLKFDRQITV